MDENYVRAIWGLVHSEVGAYYEFRLAKCLLRRAIFTSMQQSAGASKAGARAKCRDDVNETKLSILGLNHFGNPQVGRLDAGNTQKC